MSTLPILLFLCKFWWFSFIIQICFVVYLYNVFPTASYSVCRLNLFSIQAFLQASLHSLKFTFVSRSVVSSRVGYVPKQHTVTVKAPGTAAVVRSGNWRGTCVKVPHLCNLFRSCCLCAPAKILGMFVFGVSLIY